MPKSIASPLSLLPGGGATREGGLGCGEGALAEGVGGLGTFLCPAGGGSGVGDRQPVVHGLAHHVFMDQTGEQMGCGVGKTDIMPETDGIYVGSPDFVGYTSAYPAADSEGMQDLHCRGMSQPQDTVHAVDIAFGADVGEQVSLLRLTCQGFCPVTFDKGIVGYVV